MVAEVDSGAVVTHDVLGARVLVVASANQFHHPETCNSIGPRLEHLIIDWFTQIQTNVGNPTTDTPLTIDGKIKRQE